MPCRAQESTSSKKKAQGEWRSRVSSELVGEGTEYGAVSQQSVARVSGILTHSVFSVVDTLRYPRIFGISALDAIELSEISGVSRESGYFRWVPWCARRWARLWFTSLTIDFATCQKFRCV